MRLGISGKKTIESGGLGTYEAGKKINIIARLLPRTFFLDARDDVGVGDEVLEEVAPMLLRTPRIGKHIAQFADPIVGEGGDRLVRTAVDTDDDAIAEIVVNVDDCLQHLRVRLYERLAEKHYHTSLAKKFGIDFEAYSATFSPARNCRCRRIDLRIALLPLDPVANITIPFAFNHDPTIV